MARDLRPFICALLVWFTAGAVRADVTVSASVDRNRFAVGESIQLTISVSGARGAPTATIPTTSGLSFAGPAVSSNFSFINGQASESVSLIYQVSAAQVGAFTIPAVTVSVDGRECPTQPIPLTVSANPVFEELKDKLFARVRFGARQVYIGQTVPLEVLVFARQDVPVRGLSSFNATADQLGYQYLPQLKQGTQTIDGQAFRVFVIEGSLSPTQPGQWVFGPAVIQAQLTVRSGRQRAFGFDDGLFDQLMGNVQVREVPIETAPLPIEVLPLPVVGQPPGFGGAVGEWNLAVEAKPTTVAVGDPVTLTITVSGRGNIDTVPVTAPAFPDQFRTYEPTTKTTKNELGAEGERVIQQVLIPSSAEAAEIPAIELVYFDPVQGAYRTARQPPIALTIMPAGETAAATIVGAESGGWGRRPERLGEDIVYLKSDLGPVVPARPFAATGGFWLLQLVPPGLWVVGLIWKKRRDKLRDDIAYARRRRAARQARQAVESATTYDQAQQALQTYLGDRLNIPHLGITVTVVDEQLLPRGVDAALAERVRRCFEICDQARFAGGTGAPARLQETIAATRQVIDELETSKI